MIFYLWGRKEDKSNQKRGLLNDGAECASAEIARFFSPVFKGLITDGCGTAENVALMGEGSLSG